MKIYINEKNSKCAYNYQTEYINILLKEHFEIVDDISQADINIFTDGCCSCLQSIKYAIYHISKILENKKPSSRSYFIGCMARNFKNKQLNEMIHEWLNKQFDYVLSPEHPELLLKAIDNDKFSEIASKEYGASLIYDKNNLAKIYLTEGCLNNCSFCKVNYQKWPLLSTSIEKVKYDIDRLDENKVAHVQLSGMNLSQYGFDLYNSYELPTIIEYIENKQNIKTIGLCGLAFKDAIQNKFQKTLKNSSKVDFIQASLESGSNRILKLMRKGITAEEVIEFITEINKIYPKETLINIISGFPTETLEDIQETINVLCRIKANVVYIHNYANSTFVDSNNYEQLSKTEITNHTKIYVKKLKEHAIGYIIN